MRSASVESHVLHETNRTIVSYCSSNQAAFKGKVFAGKRTSEALDETFVIATQVTDSSCSGVDVTCGYICTITDVSVMFDLQGLAGSHHYLVAFPFWVEVGAALGSTHWQAGQAVFEDVCELWKVQRASRHSGVKTHASFAAPDRVIGLNSLGTSCSDVALVAFPTDMKNDHTIGGR